MYDTESSDEDIGILKKALDIDLPENFDPQTIPQTGEEYLHHVIYERTTKCKKCVTAKVDFQELKKNQTVYIIEEDKDTKRALAKFYPTKQWQEESVQDFIKVREYINDLSDDIKEPSVDYLNAEEFLEKIEKTTPKYSQIVVYTQAAKIKILDLIACRLNKYCDEADKQFNRNVGVWIYGILALLEKPLTPDCCFILREMAKKCISLRASYSDEIAEKEAIPLNLFICIIAKYFNQLDLID